MPAADHRFFVDTNVLLYSVDSNDPEKREAARAWLEHLWKTGSGHLSWQVLHEFYVNAVRKSKTATPGARSLVQTFTFWRPVDTNLALIERAWHWTDKAQLSYWDALVVAAAERSGCQWLLTEDLQTDRSYGPVTVVNPFRVLPDSFNRK
jgi:predicted nucleic acid-binding protein